LIVEQIRQLNAEGRSRDAIDLGHSELSLSPMERGLYRELGYSEISGNGSLSVADAAFAAERALNPTSAKIPYDQGILWMNRDVARTAPLWGEALHNHARIQQGGGYANLVVYYGRLLSQARPHPALFQALGEFSTLSPDLQIVWMASSPNVRMEDVANDPTFLERLTSAQRRDFLISWFNRGGKPALENFLLANPDWEDAAWPVRVRQMLEKKNYAEAIEAVKRRYNVDLSLPSLDSHVLEGSDPPVDLSARVAYFVARGNSVTARREVVESAQAKQPEGLRLRCILALKAGDAQAAWSALQAYLNETKRGNFP
jgi:hypothetical protein